jgi:hypothetical protein
MKIIYWKSRCLTDSDCYSIRAPTKKAAKAEREAAHRPNEYTEPYKVEVEYFSGFDLLAACLSEHGVWEDENGPDDTLTV